MDGHESTGEHRDASAGRSISDAKMRVELERTELLRGQATELAYRIIGQDGQTVRDVDVEHEKQMHLIVVRRDLTGFQHLHPRQDSDGTWRAMITLPAAGSYRMFADFSHGGQPRTLAADLSVDGEVDWRELPAESSTAKTADGYEVRVEAGTVTAGRETELRFMVARGGQPVPVEPYLGAGGHLVAFREGDLAYLHVHPIGHAGSDLIAFMTAFPTEGRYRLFLQFKHDGEVHTAAFTRDVEHGSGGVEEPKAEGGHHH